MAGDQKNTEKPKKEPKTLQDRVNGGIKWTKRLALTGLLVAIPLSYGAGRVHEKESTHPALKEVGVSVYGGCGAILNAGSYVKDAITKEEPSDSLYPEDKDRPSYFRKRINNLE